MATKKSSGWSDESHESNFGNVSKVHFRHVFTAADGDGDVIRLGKMGMGVKYYSAQLVSPTGLGTAVAVDLGYHGSESGTEDGDYFVDGETGLATAADKTISMLRLMTADVAASATGDPDYAELHEIVLTVDGDVDAGAIIDVVLTYESVNN